MVIQRAILRSAIALLIALTSAPVLSAPPPEGSLATESGGAAGARKAAIELPEEAGSWTRPDPPERIVPEALFDYMNGGAEIYLGYRFDHLDVYEYTSPAADDLLVELYWMDSSDDAYGLLSNDWRGDPVRLAGAFSPGEPADSTGIDRALYTSGMLRLWSGNLYARAIVYEESEEAKAAVLEIGRTIVAGRRDPPPPPLISALPSTAGSDFRLVQSQICFFRSHHVLNSIHFVNTQNVLDLGPSTEAVLATYERASGDGEESTRLLILRHTSPGAARRAIEQFEKSSASGAGAPVVELESTDRGFVHAHAPMVYGISGRNLALVFDSPDLESGHRLVSRALEGLDLSGRQ
jgi:hypothetical protein